MSSSLSSPAPVANDRYPDLRVELAFVRVVKSGEPEPGSLGSKGSKVRGKSSLSETFAEALKRNGCAGAKYTADYWDKDGDGWVTLDASTRPSDFPEAPPEFRLKLTEFPTTVQYPHLAEQTITVPYPTVTQTTATVQHPLMAQPTATVQHPTVAQPTATVPLSPLAQPTAPTPHPTMSQPTATVQHPLMAQPPGTVQHPLMAQPPATVQHPTVAQPTATVPLSPLAQPPATSPHPTVVRVAAANPGTVAAAKPKVPSKTTGKFPNNIKRTLAPTTSGGKERSSFHGSNSVPVPMNADREEKVRKFMATHDNFESTIEVDGNDKLTNWTLDHYKCLMIRDEVKIPSNGDGKFNKYPRYLKVLVGPGECFSRHSEITPANQHKAHDYLARYVSNELIWTQNIKKVPAAECTPKARETLITKLISNYKHGIDYYLELLQKLASNQITLLQPAAAAAAKEATAKRTRDHADGPDPSLAAADKMPRLESNQLPPLLEAATSSAAAAAVARGAAPQPSDNDDESRKEGIEEI